MPPKFKFTREEIIQAGLELTREQGFSAVTARALGARLGCSVKPIFTLFQNMEQVQQEILSAAHRQYLAYLEHAIEQSEYPPYKASGMAYIHFAQEERELFKLLFMRDRSQEEPQQSPEETQRISELVQAATGLDRESAYLFHLETWIYVHGVASMLATSYLDWDEQFISQSLTDIYQGLRHRFCGKGETKV